MIHDLRSNGQTWSQVDAHFPKRSPGAAQHRFQNVSRRPRKEVQTFERATWSNAETLDVIYSRDILEVAWLDIAIKAGRTVRSVSEKYYEHKRKSHSHDVRHKAEGKREA